MAPIKRPATGGVESAKKRVKPIIPGLALADGEYPTGVLISILEFSLGEFKDKRSAMQNEAVAMIGDALVSAEKALVAKVGDAQTKCDGAYAEKDKRIKAEAAARQALDGLKAAVEAAVGEEKKVKAECDTAVAVLKEAEAEQKTGDKPYNAVAAKKGKIETTQAEVYTPLKEHTMKETETRKFLMRLLAFGKELSFDMSLLESAPAALSKKPEDRGDFDKSILTHMDTQFQKCSEGVASEIQALEPAKQEREAKVNEAKKLADAVQAKMDAAKTAVKEAKQSLKAGEELLKTSASSVNNWLPDIKGMFDTLEKATAQLDDFRVGSLQTYAQLKDMDTPPEPQEEEPEPEVAEEPAAVASEEITPAATEGATAADVA